MKKSSLAMLVVCGALSAPSFAAPSVETLSQCYDKEVAERIGVSAHAIGPDLERTHKKMAEIVIELYKSGESVAQINLQLRRVDLDSSFEYNYCNTMLF